MNYSICPICGLYKNPPPQMIACKCFRQKEPDPIELYQEYMRKRQEPVKLESTMDFDRFADLVAAKVVALLGKQKKKRRASK